MTVVDPDIKNFLDNSRLYMHVEDLGANWEKEFSGAIHGFTREAEKEQFRRGFAKACLGGVTSQQYEHATGWEFDSDEALREHLEHYWNLFYPDSRPADWASPTGSFSSFEGYRGWKNQEGDTVHYSVERVDGLPVVRVTELKLLGRTLQISYELASPSIYDGFARQLIREKILADVCLGAYDGKADRIAYSSSTAKKVVEVPYADRLSPGPIP